MVEAEAHSPEMKTSGGTEEIAHNLKHNHQGCKHGPCRGEEVGGMPGAIFGNVCQNEQSSSWCEAKVENGRYSLQASHSTEIPSTR